MNKIEIEIGMWESAPCPICTKNVDLDEAEMLLYASAVQCHGKEVVEDYINNQGEYERDKWTSEYDRFSEWLCAEEEAIVIECGGVYYEDMDNE